MREEAVDDFVDGAVAPDRDDEVVPLAERLPGQLGRVQRALGEGVRALTHRLAHGLRDGVEVALGGPSSRLRIDD